MANIKSIVISAALSLTLVAGIAYAQGGVYGPADPEVLAALNSLEDAMAHLQNARNATRANVRARAYIALAMTELDPAANSFRFRGRVAPQD